ncbi:MAG: ABC transporter permease subunit, partial [Hydrogenophaga sp.]
MVSAVFHSPLEGSPSPKAESPPLSAVAPAALPRPAPAPPVQSRRGWDLRFLWTSVLPPVLGLVFLVTVWAVVAGNGASGIPTPLETWKQALEVFSDPFYQVGPNDQGVGWNVLMSLQRVAIGFGLAAAVGIPAGFAIGRFEFLSRMFNPLISLLRPVSPLAWLPIGLLVFKGANPAAIWTIFICSIWPMIINTAVGVQRVPQDYMNVARVLNLS